MKAVGFVCAALLSIACGGGETPAAKTADDEAPEAARENKNAPAISADIGGLNKDEVDQVFAKVQKRLEKCMDSGAKRVEFLGGDVTFFLKIDLEGKVAHAHVERSTLGERATEKCMLDALRARDWPKPVGGEVGIARSGFTFDMRNDVREPTAWSSEDAAPGLEKIGAKLDECRHGKSGFEATLYVDTEGKVLGASVTPPDEDGEQSVDCMVEALESATFPSPGSWPAKVTLGL
jgi:hypothetical protein